MKCLQSLQRSSLLLSSGFLRLSTVYQGFRSTTMNFSAETSKQNAHHDTHAHPPMHIQEAYWHYNKVKLSDLENDREVVDFSRGLTAEQEKVFLPVGTVPAQKIEDACIAFRNHALKTEGDATRLQTAIGDATVYEHQEFPGLQIVPGILPPETQVLLLSQLMHRDLANSKHKINLEADYQIPYPLPRQGPADTETQNDVEYNSFFTYPQAAKDISLTPKDPSKHKPLNTAQFLAKKLRWLTIGEQYDWPTRSYPKNGPTSFPSDISRLVSGLFPHIKAESGVVLLYSPKDYMPVHRDVSEQCERGLASFSLGCDGIFVVARGEDEVEGGGRTVALRVKSGDVIHMDGETRWAWHAMPRTIAGTCPEWMAQWPVGTPGASEEERKMYDKWRGYMAGKRLNISCRQVWD